MMLKKYNIDPEVLWYDYDIDVSVSKEQLIEEGATREAGLRTTDPKEYAKQKLNK